MINRFFGVAESGSSISTEVRAGVTTFLTMAYILLVNPSILGKVVLLGHPTAMPQLMAATAIAAAAGTLVMGLIANYPFALAPGMGLNAFFTFSVVIGQGVTWQVALGTVFLSGVLFIVLSTIGVRRAIIEAIPNSIKKSTAVGVGLFLAVIGLMNAEVIVDNPNTLVHLGRLSEPAPLLLTFGLILTAILIIRKIPGAIFWGIISTTAVAILSHANVYNGGSFAGFPTHIVQSPVWPTDLWLAMDVAGALQISLASVIFAFLFVDFFDTAGTLIGLAEEAKFTDEKGNLPRASQAFLADAFATTFSAFIGTSPTTCFIESATGIEEGGRTGLTAVVIAALFMLSLFFWPLANTVPAVATAPALVIVGTMMMASSASINWRDMGEAVPAFLTIVGMPMTYSISNGIAFGIISAAAIHLLSGRAKSLHWIMYVLAVLLSIMLCL